MKNIIAISAPSGTGKSTLCEELRRKKPQIKFSVSLGDPFLGQNISNFRRRFAPITVELEITTPP